MPNFQELQSITNIPAFHMWLKQSYINLHVIGDLHIGAPTSRYQEAFKRVATSTNRDYFLFVGDQIDNAIIDSVEPPYNSTLSPQMQLQEFYDFLKRYKHKIVGVLSGNHERRTSRKVGIDVLKLVTQECGIPYSDTLMVLDIAVGNSSRGSKGRADYVIVAGHGYGGARTVGGKINAGHRLAEVIVNADIYISGHTHQPAVVKETRIVFDKYNKRISTSDYYVVIVPAWLEYTDYEAWQFRRPKPFGWITLRLDGKSKKVTPVLE